MRWNVDGRLPLEDRWRLELQEAQTVADKQSSSRLVAMYKVAAQRRITDTGDVESADDLNQKYIAWLPLHEYLELEAVWPLRPFWSFVEDCRTDFPRRPLPKQTLPNAEDGRVRPDAERTCCTALNPDPYRLGV